MNVGSVECRLTVCRLRGIGLVTVGSLNVGSVTGTPIYTILLFNNAEHAQHKKVQIFSPTHHSSILHSTWTRQVSRITRESHGFWQFLKAHSRETQYSRIFVNLTECCDQGILICLRAYSLLVGRQGTPRLIIKVPRL